MNVLKSLKIGNVQENHKFKYYINYVSILINYNTQITMMKTFL